MSIALITFNIKTETEGNGVKREKEIGGEVDRQRHRVKDNYSQKVGDRYKHRQRDRQTEKMKATERKKAINQV